MYQSSRIAVFLNLPTLSLCSGRELERRARTIANNIIVGNSSSRMISQAPLGLHHRRTGQINNINNSVRCAVHVMGEYLARLLSLFRRAVCLCNFDTTSNGVYCYRRHRHCICTRERRRDRRGWVEQLLALFVLLLISFTWLVYAAALQTLYTRCSFCIII